MTSRQILPSTWKRIFPALPLVYWIIILTSHLVCGAPPRDSNDKTQADERWLADGSFYDYEYVGDQPQADGHNFLVASDLCPPVPKKLPLGGCDVEACSSDRECAHLELKCCYNGCVYTCLPEVKPPPHFDWIREPVRRLQFGQSWLVPGPDDIVDVELCSTTPLDDDADPLVCPNGYECSIDDVGDANQGVPNRGHCVKIVDDVTSQNLHYGASPKQDSSMENDGNTVDTASLHACHLEDERILLSGHSMTINERTCLCHETRLICDD